MKKLNQYIKSLPGDFIPRSEFPVHIASLAKFQGHHRKALQSLRQLSFKIDLVLELRDSRAPISSINPLFDQVLRGKQKLVLYTKTDIAKLKHSTIQAWDPTQDFLRIENGLVKDAKRIFTYMREAFESTGPAPPLGYNVLITGMPNAGKSTLINTLRRHGLKLGRHAHSVARVGNQPGITRKMSETIRIQEGPDIFIYDTPGVFVPQVADAQTMMNLALINAVHAPDIDPTLLADYLLYHINKEYPRGGRYPGPLSNSIDTVLRSLSRTNRRRGPYNDTAIANEWLTRYRNGGLAKLCLDDTSIENYRATMERNAKLTVDLGPMVPDFHLRKRLMI